MPMTWELNDIFNQNIHPHKERTALESTPMFGNDCGRNIDAMVLGHSTSNHPVVPHGPFQIWPKQFLKKIPRYVLLKYTTFYMMSIISF